MNLIVIHKNNNSPTSSNNGLLRLCISSEPIASVIFDGLSKNLQLNGDTNVAVAIPERWAGESRLTSPKIEHYRKDIPLSYKQPQLTRRNCWFVISDGRFATQIDRDLLDKVLADIRADVAMVNVKPELLAYREKVQLTAQGKVAGFRRLYSDSAEPAPIPPDWPHHIFIKTNVLDQVLANHTLPQSFSALLKRCRSNALTLRAMSVGGTILDLDTEQGLLGFLTTKLNPSVHNYPNSNNKSQKEILDGSSVTISDSARLFGKVLFGQNVNIGQNAIIVGPAIISNNVKIGKGAVIRASIIGPDVSVPRNHLIENRVLLHSQPHQKQTERIKMGRLITSTNVRAAYKNSCPSNFRTWPRFAYARCLKRIADIVAAVTALVLFAPILPLIALVIKLTSRGPVFFKDTRQGLHSRAFNCLKFRTMLVGADKMQDKLRVLNQADGPQFKLADDPRLDAVGRFLRDTYIDEVPQFFNVLFGQMSLVGPRPSPESENTLCPPWRDARLSVRPGMTGLWQVCRTRQPMKDFQEWIHYDIKYVRNLSLKLDLWVCWQTAKQLVKNFIRQF